MKLSASISYGKKSKFASTLLATILAFVWLGLAGQNVMAASSKAKPKATQDIGMEPGAKKFEEIDPKNFDRSENIDNAWWPLKPGSQWTVEGTTEEDGKKIPHKIVMTVTDLTKMIGGVRTRVVLDEDYSDGKLAEKELVFFAQDKVGNVWHLGQYVEHWEDKQFVGGQAWHVGNPDGAKAGIMMPADPKAGTMSYSEGYAPAPFFWTDRGRVYQTGQKVKVPAGTYNDVLVIEEFDEKHTGGVFQLKYYARDVGNIRVGWRGKKAVERENLEMTKFLQLSPKEMAEVRATALELEKRANLYSKLPAME